MEIDPTSFFKNLNEFSKDQKRGPDECLRLLQTLNRNLIEEQIDLSFIDLFLIHIFEKPNGLISFLDATVKNKDFKKAVIEALEILYTLVNNFPSKLVESNIVDLYALCNTVVKLHAVSDVKVKALELLLVSLDKLDISFETFDISSTYKEILNCLQIALRQKHCDTVRHKELVVLGYFAKRYQYLISNYKDLQMLFVRNIDPELFKPKKSQQILCGFFTGFSYFCESFPLNLNKNEDKKLIENKLYKLIYNLAVPTDRIKNGNRAALTFLASNIGLFGELLLKDYQYWHTKLLNWLDMGAEEKKVGAAVLRAFFQELSTILCHKTEKKDWGAIGKYFNQWALSVLDKKNVSTYNKHSAIHCLKFFWGASYKYLPENDVTQLFLIIMRNFENNYILNYDPRSEEWQYLPDYVQTVANFMQFKTFKASEFYCLQRAVINMIKSFHQLPYLHYNLVIDGIVITCFYLKKTEYFDPFLENMIYQGVMWSCSHQHISNADFSEEIHQKVVTVKNFFPLWTGILKLSSNRSYDKYGLYLQDRKYILERIVSQLVKTLMILINKLNLSVKLNEGNVTLTELEKVYQVEQTSDHAIFLNVVDLYQELFDNIEPKMFKRCICRMIKHILNKCVRNPLISGFYKLLSYTLKIANKLDLFKEDNVNQDVVYMKETLRQFLELLLDKVAQYKDELLIACLRVLLESPVVLIKDMLPICVSPFIAVFNIGRSYFPLAEMGLDTLTRWQDCLYGEEFDEFLSKIVPSLDSYLRSKSLLGQTQSNVLETRRKTAQVLKKRKVVLETEPELVKLQRKMLSFIGRQSTKVCHSFVYSDELNEIVPISVYGGNVHLKVTLPYEDVHIDVFLDVFVPRIVNLALYSSDRKTKITACELLQAIVMVFLGRAKPMSQAGLSELEDLLKAVSMPLLQLGCDIDQLVQQIFTPLVFQLIHWYASPSQLRGSHTAIVIDSLMEGITHPTNSCLRDFSGKCVKEFVKWTIKQTGEKLLHTDPINIKILIKKMRFFSTHSDPTKKLGAALIFNNIYREIREEESLISVFWFEILHIFISSLSLSENNSIEDGHAITQINNALSHLERVFVEKPHIFRVSDAKRRVPSDINGDTLKDVAVWLLKQTGNNSSHCRKASMDLFVAIAPLTSGKKVNLKVFINGVFRNDFMSCIYEKSLATSPFLEGISHSEDCSVLLKWMQSLCCALDGYNFVIKNNLWDINFENNTFNVVNYFLKHVQEADMAAALNLVERKTWTFTALDMEQFKKQKCACIVSILKVFNGILLEDVLLKESTRIWTVEFWQLILNLIFNPQRLGLENRVVQPKYLELLTLLLNNLPRKISQDSISELVRILHDFTERNYTTNIDLKRNVTLLQRNIMNGLLLLQSTNISKCLNIEKYVEGLVNDLMQSFYSTLKENVLYINDFQETVFEYCISILKLSLTNAKEFKKLVHHLHQPYLVQSMEFNKEVKFGIFFLYTFGEVVIPFILKDFDNFMKDSIEIGSLETTLDLVTFILSYITKNKSYKQYYKNTSNILLNNWHSFQTFLNTGTESTHVGVECIKLLAPICDLKDAGQLNDWLINLLLKEDDLNGKLQIFYLLASTVNDSNLQSGSPLEKALQGLFDKISTESISTNFLCEKMLSSISTLKSSTILKFLITLYGKLTTDLDVATLLKQFVSTVDIQTQQSSLKITYELSKNADVNFESRYKIIKDILPPLFQTCHISCFEEFFKEHINEMITDLQKSEQFELNILNFVLTELLFLRIPIGSADRTDCPIANAANNPKLLNLFLKFTLEAFKKHSPTSEKVLRLYKCHAYNALASIVSNSVKSPNFYEKLFVRQENGKDILWNSIIDTSVSFEFPFLFDSIPTRRKVIINIRDELRAQRKEEQKTKSLKYIESQKLFSSSLSEDVTNFDFTNSSVRTQKGGEEESDNELISYQSEIQLEAVDFNNHECMGTVCGLIKHIFETSVNELPQEQEEEVELSNWMKGIRNTLLSDETHKNIKLFLVKVIDNMIHIFSHYSQWFVEPLLQFIVDKCAGDNLNYFVTDVICILAKWASDIKKLNDKEKKLTSEMLHFLISNLSTDRVNVFKFNLDLVKLIVESWKKYIDVPREKLLEILSSDSKCEIGIHLASIFLVNNLEPWQSNNSEVFMTALLKKLNFPKKLIYKPCAETVGLALKYLNGLYVEVVDKQIKAITDFDKYVHCLQGVAIHFPQLVNAYHVAKLISTLNQFPDAQKMVHLKIILRRVEISLDILSEINEFKIVEWSDLLESANLEIQIITLRIIKACLGVFADYKIYPNIIKTLGKTVTHPNALYRNCVYDIALLVLKEDKDVSDTCKEILIYGLVDEDADNKEKVVSFWRENSNLPNTVADRFSYLFSNLYKAKVEDCFLSYVNYFLISVLKTREEYNDMIFEHPLEDCNFEDYRLQLNWRLQHPSVVPLFAETLANTQPGELYDNPNLFHLKETQANLSFSQTQSVKEQEFSKYTSLDSSFAINISDGEGSIKNPNELVLSHKYRLPNRGRFLKDKSKISIISAHKETQKQIKKVAKRKDLAKERERKVTIYRNYRKGDFPDIQISLSSILEPLQMLCLHDGEVAKILLTEIFKGITLKIGNNDLFMQSILGSIQYIFNNSSSFNPNLISTLLDILLRHKDKFHFEQPQLISYVCQQSGLLSIGTLLLEEYLISSDDLPSTSKKGAATEENKETVYWVKLAELYKELEEWDMVRSIFLEKMNCKDIIQEAIQYESETQWRNAQELYAELIETDVSAERKDFYYDSYFKCFANLGEWEHLPKAIESVVTTTKKIDVWTMLWDKDWCQQKLLPWYIQAQVKNTLFNQKWSEEFSNNINNSLSCAEKAEYLQTNFSEELCILWLYKKDIASSTLYLNSCVKNFLSNWQLLNPMYQSLRYDKILQLRNVMEVDAFVTVYKNLSDDFEDTLKKVTNAWKLTSNEVLPSILLSETRVLYRTLFINTLKEKVSKFELTDTDNSLENLETTKAALNMAFIESAIELSNYYVSRKYLKKCRNQEDLRFKLAFGNIAFLKAKTLTKPLERLNGLIQTVEIFGSLFSSANDPNMLLPANIKYFDIATEISNTFRNTPELFPEFRQTLVTKFGTQINTPENINSYASNKLRLAVENLACDNMDCDNIGTTSRIKHVADAYVKLAYFAKDRDDENLQRDFILYVLRAMKLNSLEAKQLFPCILIQNRLGSDYIQLFVDETEKIPTWMFLGWIPQLLANLDSKKIRALSKIVLRIAETYPQAIMYPYRLSKEHYNFSNNEVAAEAQSLINKLDDLLLNDPMIDKFLKALSYVSVPAVVLRYYISKMYKSERADEVKAIHENILKNVFVETPNSKNTNNMQGNMFNSIAGYKRNIEKILTSKKMKEELAKIDGQLKNLLETKKDSLSVLLKDYCPWLANFSANQLNVELEIPGQYTGEKMPLPQHHIKISGFYPNVKIMKSLRKPIKLTIIGMDTKEYPFLVKFGEDIRQDQRIEQLFGLMNGILKSDVTCNRSNLEILTYQVIPLTSNLGMIQWIDTEPLSDFLKKSLSTREIKDLEKISLDYCNWLCNGRSPAISYGLSAMRYNRNKTIAFYRSLVNRIPWDVLRKSFWSLSSTTENYIALRNNFIKTYAVICVSHWILGIGDRHLDNSKICIRNGKVLGIDFGHAFGTATQIQPVPDLVPFRLTPHIVSLMEPLKERGQFRQCMIHSLRAFRANHNSLMATMNVFVEEPSLDWLEHASNSKQQISEEKHDWYPNVKVNQAKRKLEGASSTKIMVEDLLASKKDPQHVQAYIKWVNGSAEFDKRTKLVGDNLSIEDQVDCLLDHATDYNLLGRMWVGWMPWV